MPSTYTSRSRHQQALDLRTQGQTYQQIADALGYSTTQGARHAVQQAAARNGVVAPAGNGNRSTRRRVLTRKFGVEIEFNGISSSQAVAALQAAGIDVSYHGYTHRVLSTWKIVTDGSVAGSGLELVSPILKGESGYAAVILACQALTAAGARIDSSCGVHVHHDANDLDGEALAQFIEIYAGRQDSIDRLVSRGRRLGGRQTRWCNRLSSREVENIGNQFRADRTAAYVDRYRTINTQSFPRYGTIEIRQHQGSLNGEKIVAWVKFGQAIARAAQDNARDNLSTSLFEFISDLNRSHGLDADAAEFLLTRAIRLG